MISKKRLILALLSFSSVSFASETSQFAIPFDSSLKTDGSVTVDLTSTSGYKVTKSFYGADSHGFSQLPIASMVKPLQLGYVKLGGNLHSTYNWEHNAYYDDAYKNISYVYSPLERRLTMIQSYNASPMFQVNMLGLQPDMDATGKLTLQDTASASHAADAVTFINGTKKIGLQHILMGNEPFHSQEVHGKPIPSADEYIDSFIEYAVAVRKAQEKISGNSNDIKLWGPEIATGWTAWQTTHRSDCVFNGDLPERYRCSYGNGQFTEFMPYFLSRIAEFENDSVKNPKKYKMLDYVTWHYYPLFRKVFKDPTSFILNSDGTQNVLGMLESVNLWDSENYVNKYDNASPKGVAPKIISKFKSWKAKYYPNAKLSVTEFGIDSVPNIAYHPIVRPMYLADLIARLGGAGVDTFINSFLQNGSNVNGWELINGNEKTKLYNIFSLYSNNYLGKVLNSTDNYGDKVNVYSVKTDVGTNVFLVNKDQAAHTTDLSFKMVTGQVNITQVALPAWSVTLLKVPENRNGKILVEQYGAKEMGITVPTVK